MPSKLFPTLDSYWGPTICADQEDDRVGFKLRGHGSKSDAVRRIMGLDRPRLLDTAERTGPLPVLKGQPVYSLPGLGNWDHSCYQNSVLQGLAALRQLPTYLENASSTDDLQPTKAALKTLTTELNDPENFGMTLWTPSVLKSMSSWQQQDAQEYFSKLLDEIEKDNANMAKRTSGNAGLRVVSSVKANESSHSQELENKLADGRGGLADRNRRLSNLPEELTSLIARNPLEGLLAQRVGCQQCGFVEGLSLVPFNCLTVPLGKEWMYDVRACLDDYTALELINGVECAKCTLVCTKTKLEQTSHRIKLQMSEGKSDVVPETSKALIGSLQERLDLVDKALDDEDFSENMLKNCQIPPKNRVLTTKSRQAVVARAPKSLVIHVNRSNFDELTGVQSKNLAGVSFPLLLNMAPWCLGLDPGPKKRDEESENWNMEPTKSMLSLDENTTSLSSWTIYELQAVITHYGRHENGHYICYRKSPFTLRGESDVSDQSSNSWWRLSDEEVTEVSVDNVLAQGGVFMLFYEQSGPLAYQGPKSMNTEKPVADTVLNSLGSLQIGSPLEGSASDHNKSLQPIAERQASTLTDLLPASASTLRAANFDSHHAKPQQNEDLHKIFPSGANGEDAVTDLPTPLTVLLQPQRATTSSSQLPIISKPSPPRANQKSADRVEQIPSATIPKENQPISPSSMRTAGPRSGRGSVGRAAKAMGSVSGFVQAN